VKWFTYDDSPTKRDQPPVLGSRLESLIGELGRPVTSLDLRAIEHVCGFEDVPELVRLKPATMKNCSAQITLPASRPMHQKRTQVASRSGIVDISGAIEHMYAQFELACQHQKSTGLKPSTATSVLKHLYIQAERVTRTVNGELIDVRTRKRVSKVQYSVINPCSARAAQLRKQGVAVQPRFLLDPQGSSRQKAVVQSLVTAQTEAALKADRARKKAASQRRLALASAAAAAATATGVTKKAHVTTGLKHKRGHMYTLRQLPALLRAEAARCATCELRNQPVHVFVAELFGWTSILAGDSNPNFATLVTEIAKEFKTGSAVLRIVKQLLICRQRDSAFRTSVAQFVRALLKESANRKKIVTVDVKKDSGAEKALAELKSLTRTLLQRKAPEASRLVPDADGSCDRFSQRYGSSPYGSARKHVGTHAKTDKFGNITGGEAVCVSHDDARGTMSPSPKQFDARRIAADAAAERAYLAKQGIYSDRRSVVVPAASSGRSPVRVPLDEFRTASSLNDARDAAARARDAAARARDARAAATKIERAERARADRALAERARVARATRAAEAAVAATRGGSSDAMSDGRGTGSSARGRSLGANAHADVDDADADANARPLKRSNYSSTIPGTSVLGTGSSPLQGRPEQKRRDATPSEQIRKLQKRDGYPENPSDPGFKYAIDSVPEPLLDLMKRQLRLEEKRSPLTDKESAQLLQYRSDDTLRRYITEFQTAYGGDLPTASAIGNRRGDGDDRISRADVAARLSMSAPPGSAPTGGRFATGSPYLKFFSR
jgi:hypothetical protein